MHIIHNKQGNKKPSDKKKVLKSFAKSIDKLKKMSIIHNNKSKTTKTFGKNSKKFDKNTWQTKNFEYNKQQLNKFSSAKDNKCESVNIKLTYRGDEKECRLNFVIVFLLS